MTVHLDNITSLPSHEARKLASVRLKVRRERQQRTTELRRQQLLQSARQLLTEVGPKAFNMREFGARAGYTVGALYLYFPSRHHLLNELKAHFLNEIGERVRQSSIHKKAGKLSGKATDLARTARPYPVLPDQPQGQFWNRNLGWWQALADSTHGLELLLHQSHEGPVVRPRDDLPVAPLIASLAKVTWPCTQALIAMGLSTQDACEQQEELLCLGVGLLALHQDAWGEAGVRARVQGRFERAIQRCLQGLAPAPEKVVQDGGESQSDLFAG